MLEPATDDPLGPEHHRELELGRVRMARVRRAAAVAAFSGWTLAAFGGLTLLGVLFGSLSSLLLGGALIGLGVNELGGGRQLRALDPRGPRRLGFNQLALAAVAAVYAGWKLVGVATTDPLAGVGSTGDADMDAMIRGLQTSIGYAVYGSVLVLGTTVPALTAWYYFRRRRLIDAVLAETPAWVVRTMRSAA